jgi:S1 RNA binding domain protein
MPLTAGETVEAVITKITNYGAFVELPEGRRGLIHISEIANAFVKDVNDYLKERQKVRVKVLNVSSDGRKIDLSVKQADTVGVSAPAGERPRPMKVRPLSNSYGPASGSFEDKLTRFLKSSEEKLADLRRNTESKRGGDRSR